VIFSIFAAYTNGNGIFVFFIGIGILLLDSRGGAFNNRPLLGNQVAAMTRYRWLILWLLAGIVYVGFYFIGYSKNPSQTDVFSFLAREPLVVAEFFPALAGSAFDFGWARPWPAVAGGAGLLLGLGFVVARFLRKPPVRFGKMRRRNGLMDHQSENIESSFPVVLTSWIVFILLSLAATAVSRAPMGLEQAFTPRYKFLSILALILLYLAGIEILTRRAESRDEPSARHSPRAYIHVRVGGKWTLGQSPGHRPPWNPAKRAYIVLSIVFSMAFSALSYSRNFRTVRDHKFVLSMNLFDWDGGKADLPYPNPEHADRIMRLAVVRKIYRPPAVLNIRRPKYPVGKMVGERTEVINIGPSESGATLKKVSPNDMNPSGRENSLVTGSDIFSRGGIAFRAGNQKKEQIFTGWALDDGGRPSVIVRRSVLERDKGQNHRSDGLVYLGKAHFKNESIPNIVREYFGYPGMDRMVWEFRIDADEFELVDGKSTPAGDGGGVTLHFFARDRLGRETLIGVRSQHLNK
jgi:hypothetical protein